MARVLGEEKVSIWLTGACGLAWDMWIRIDQILQHQLTWREKGYSYDKTF
jgi:hypothetical protein